MSDAAACDHVVPAVGCLHTESMRNVLVRGVPDDVHAQLQRRAARHGLSLQQYLSRELELLARRPDLEEVLQRIAGRRGGRVGLAQAARDLRTERGS